MTPEEKQEYNRAYYQKNKERLKDDAKRWYAENTERARANSRKWYQENKSKAREANKAWLERNREQVRARNQERTRHLRFSQHNMTEHDYLALVEQQNGVCAICRLECDVLGKLSIDHCHETNSVRGLLCKRCNSGLGFFRDSSAILARAVAYLEAA